MKKKILLFILSFAVVISTFASNVKAGTPDLGGVLKFYLSPLDTSVVKDPLLSTTFYKYVQDTSKNRFAVAYCINAGRKNPEHGADVSRTGDITSPRLRYILEHGYGIVNGNVYFGDLAGYTEFQAYYITQIAVWLYQGRAGGGYNVGDLSKNNQFSQRALQLYNDSAAATSDSFSTPSITIAVNGLDLHYDAANKRYISDKIHMTGYVYKNYTISFSNAPAGTKLIWEKGGQEIPNNSTQTFTDSNDQLENHSFYLTVPASSVTGNVSGIKLTASTQAGVNKVYLYEHNDKTRQPLGVLMPDLETYTSSHEFKIKYENVSCDTAIADLIKKYPNNRSEGNTQYINELNNLRKKYTINTDVGIDNPRCSKPACNEVIAYLKKKYPKSTTPAATIDGKNYGYIPYYEDENGYIDEINALMKKYTDINVDAGYDNPSCSKPKCETVVAYLKRKYSNRTESNKEYITELNKLKSPYGIKTELGVENPSCTNPSCNEVVAYLKKKYTNRTDSNTQYINELNTFKKKISDLNTDAGVENPSCKKPSCEEVVAYLKKKYPNRTESNKEYKSELEKLRPKYGIYVDQGIENPSCSPAPGKPKCEDKVKELLEKYPNVPDRNQSNTQYVKDLDELVKYGQENGFVVYTDDIQHPDCVKHYKRELILRKIDAATGEAIAGAKLQLKDQNGNVIREWVTDGNPYVVTDLPAGKYTLTEIETPAGYTGDGYIEFTLEGEEYSVEIALKNSKIPNTADLNFTLIITAFILFLGFGVFGLIKTSKAEM